MTSATDSERSGGALGRGAALPSLTGLRFFAALLVFMAHAALLNNPLNLQAPINFYSDDTVAEGLARLFEPSGYVGVSFFFVLSGFVIAWSWRPGERTTRFWRRRLLKIYPNHVVVWAAVMILYAGAFTPLHSWLPNLFLVHSWSWAPDTSSGVNVPAWSLCSELLFYLLFPFLIRPLSRIPERRLWTAAACAVAAVAAVALTARFLIPEGPSLVLAPLPLTQMWFGYLFPPSRLPEFILGVLLARIVASGRWPRIGAVPVAITAAVAYAAVLVVPSPFNFALVTVVPIAGIIGTAASADLRGERTLLNRPLTVWLGAVSFGFYIVQAIPIFYLRHELFGGDTYAFPVATLLTLLLFAVTLFFGWVLYRFVETPVMRRWSRPRARERTRPEIKEPAPAAETGTTP
ncbi:MAG TPA: acyltransferase [Thermomonospora sp.]|nr:acyltransferase [Thermomonospora sp.]